MKSVGSHLCLTSRMAEHGVADFHTSCPRRWQGTGIALVKWVALRCELKIFSRLIMHDKIMDGLCCKCFSSCKPDMMLLPLSHSMSLLWRVLLLPQWCSTEKQHFGTNCCTITGYVANSCWCCAQPLQSVTSVHEDHSYDGHKCKTLSSFQCRCLKEVGWTIP